MPAPVSPPAVDFQTEVLEASRSRPVLVDFWAPWCGPCRVLGPVLEALAAEAGGRWSLVKVNTDEQPGLMAHFGIRGIPAVKLFEDGKVTAEFTGALPEFVLRQWLDEHLPTEARRRFDAGSAAWAAGDRDAARAHYEAALAEPDAASAAWADTARGHLARLLVFEDPDRAEALVADVYTPEAEAVRSVAALGRRDLDALPDGPPHDLYRDGLAALQAGDLDRALDHLIAVVQRDRAYDDDGARRAVVALFQTLGEDDPAVKRHRPEFNRSLY